MFLLWDEGIGEDDRSKVSLSNGIVSFDLFPGESITVSPDVEERTDFYVHLEGVDSAAEIGLKCRGGKKVSFELKTVRPRSDDTNDHDDQQHLDFWIKSRKRGSFDVKDPEAMMEFVAGCRGQQSEHSDKVMAYLKKVVDQDNPLTLVEVSKARRHGFLRGGSIIIEETDLKLRLDSSSHSLGSKSTVTTLSARSWAAEAPKNDSLLRTIAQNWDKSLRQLMQQEVGDKSQQCHIVVASYPDIVKYAADQLK